MKYLDTILEDFNKEIEPLAFYEIIRQARDKIGMMQYRAAEFMNMSISRLKNLERGYFFQMPTASEIKNISDFYKLDHDLLLKKAEEHSIHRVNTQGTGKISLTKWTEKAERDKHEREQGKRRGTSRMQTM